MKAKATLIMVFLISAMSSYAQNQKLAVLPIDNQVRSIQSDNVTELTRLLLTKYKKYEMLDRYEIKGKLSDNDINAESCFSVSCLITAGKILNADLVLSGSIDKLGDAIYISFRIIDVQTASVVNEVVKEFLYLPEKISPMISIVLNDMMGVENDKALENSLSSKSSYESAVNNPHYNTLSLSGPRMGYTFFTGMPATTLKKPKSEGGYDAYPALFQFGYQFEKQYLTEGKVQALVEVIPLITGLDQGLFIPSLTIMNGIRSNVTGFEFAIGPTFAVTKEAIYQKDINGNYVYADDNFNPSLEPEEIRLMDSRGEISFKSSVAIAFGYSFRSGRLNIPVNVYAVPAKHGTRFGFSFGFNARK